jgi:hypothetical protein
MATVYPAMKERNFPTINLRFKKQNASPPTYPETESAGPD